ncbi:hypothetical protein WMY93_026145 [Mugilogobius chulae]|uniref:C-type lectin domain-containing protein n=1 Tax=Mugilogobius chulae TaxID=88201 RepID=A0AAW0MY69_9GOBI
MRLSTRLAVCVRESKAATEVQMVPKPGRSVLVSCSRYPFRHYHFIDTEMTWPEAQQYCRQHYSDLATFESMEEVQQHLPDVTYSWAWIGLADDTSSWKGVMGKEPNSWRWSATGEHSQSGFQSWSSAEPDYYERFETCVLMDLNGGWQDKACTLLYGFVCFTESSQSQVTYTYISTQKTWSDGQAYCRQHHTDLAVIESSSQNTDVYNSITPRASAWIGLYRVPWTWSDQSLSTFRSWDTISPNYPDVQHCVATDGQVWDDDYCDTGFGPLCQTTKAFAEEDFVGMALSPTETTEVHLLLMDLTVMCLQNLLASPAPDCHLSLTPVSTSNCTCSSS